MSTKQLRRLEHLHGLDSHHLLWDKRSWSSNCYSHDLRCFWYCKITIPRGSLHAYIHYAVDVIPVPSPATCLKILLELENLDQHYQLGNSDPAEKRINLLLNFLNERHSPTAIALRKQLSVIKNYTKASY